MSSAAARLRRRILNAGRSFDKSCDHEQVPLRQKPMTRE